MQTIILEPADAPSQVGQAMHFAEQEIDHLVELRANIETRDGFGADEQIALWRLKDKIDLILSSMRSLQAAE